MEISLICSEPQPGQQAFQPGTRCRLLGQRATLPALFSGCNDLCCP